MNIFLEEKRVSLIDLATIGRFKSESIDDYLNNFRKMKSRYYTHIPKHELFKMVISCLKFPIREKLVNQQMRRMAN